MFSSNRYIIPLFLLFTIGLTSSLKSQNKYWVFFKDKNGSTFNPYEYFDQKAIDRRIQNGISLYDSTDFPLNQKYVDIVKNLSDSVSHSTRWFNGMAVYANISQISLIGELPFVESIEPINLVVRPANCELDYDTTFSVNQEEVLRKQTERMGLKVFEDNKIDGKGIRIAIFDGGFPSVDKNPAFEHIRKENRIIKTWDFAKNNEFVYSYMNHGTMVMSCIGGIINNKKIGMATGAEFLLARTEIKREPYSEEENWLAAVEWADKNGANIINSSLGYTYHRYFPHEMNGKISLVARAGNLAAKKGILVVNAAGNDGDNSWKVVGTPGDADSVLTVGGIDPETDYHVGFSSFGPTTDKRMKPNVCSFGIVTAVNPNGITTTQGTSFSSPLVAGFAACAWQTKHDLKNMELFKEIEKSGDLYPYFDYAHGFGVPQASYFFKKEEVIESMKPEIPKSNQPFELIASEMVLKVIINKEFMPDSASKTPVHLFYNIEGSNGVLEKYFVISVNQQDVLEFILTDYKKGEKLNIHYLNYTTTYEF
ncbi:MAG: S8 family serine peptidase [Bacteroidetes bacterium]|nr:S8 family serine peptidase [Bacteroidota bacterium]